MKKIALPFTKMHGLGNDFMVVNALTQPLAVETLSIPQLADRHLGIGFDQLLILEPSTSADFFCRIFNADGSEAEQCGNGLRCIARFIHENGLSPNTSLQVETKAGVFSLHIQDYDHIRTTLGIPHIEAALVQLTDNLAISRISLGNPHAILKVASIDGIDTLALAKAISAYAAFPDRANMGFMQVVNQHHIRLRTVERGAGETYACGSNAAAAAVAGIANSWLHHEVRVEFRYGSLAITWQGDNQPVQMMGPASNVFSGVVAVMLSS